MRTIIWLLLPVAILSIAFTFTEHTVSGTVTDELGMPIPFASVAVKGTTIGTTTATDGRYRLTVPAGNETLMVSAAGFTTQEVKIKNRSVVNVILKTAQQALQEVVVTGYARDIATAPYSSFRMKKMSAGVYQNNNTGFNTEDYDHINETGFHSVTRDPLSTFSIDVDAASYSNVRRFLNEGELPPAGAVRIEEMINYFRYQYPQPTGPHPFSITTEFSDCSWNEQHKIVLIGLQGKKIPAENLPPSNLVFLIDVSGSMNMPNKLPLVQSSLKLLVDQLRAEDKISIVVYAGRAGLVLPATTGNQKTKIREAIESLEAGGSTAGGEGIKLAYKIAGENFIKEGNNRVILCTDGDFNVGVSSDDELERLIEQERESGVYLTVLGYGTGNYKDNKMQKLADKGNGNHAYIDDLSEARKVLVHEFGGTLFTIAKDVKLQVEFNPVHVQGYRLIGYENRMLQKEDFNDDKKDAGELGSGHTVTALYEIIPAGVQDTFLKKVDPLKYQKKAPAGTVAPGELMTVKFRYKAPGGGSSRLIEHPVPAHPVSFAHTSNDFRFAVSVAELGLLLRNSEFKSNANFAQVLKIAGGATGADAEGYRKEFLQLVKKAAALQHKDVEDVAKD